MLSVTEEMLCNENLQLSDHFIPGIYEQRHAIELFLHIYAIAPLAENQPEQKLSTSRKREYLMMPLLEDKPEKDIQKYLTSPSKVAPLVIHFSSGCVPNGCFGSTISCLISTYNWKVNQTEESKPECLTHNIVTLSDPTLPVSITLVNCTQYLEVHTNMGSVEEEDLGDFCSSICTTIFSAFEKVFKIMRFEDIEVKPAILCPCKCSPAHAATVCCFPYIVCSRKGSGQGCLENEKSILVSK